MSAESGIIRWESTTHPSRWGAEVIEFAPRTHRANAECGRRVDGRWPIPPGFVFSSLGRHDIAAVVSRLSEVSGGSRPCVVLDQDALFKVDTDVLRRNGVGVLLDCVNSHTPLSAPCFDLVEAVRFDEKFVQQAAIDARTSCAMDALLTLCHDLGIATLASVGALESSDAMFDYVSTAVVRTDRTAPIALPKAERPLLNR